MTLFFILKYSVLIYILVEAYRMSAHQEFS